MTVTIGFETVVKSIANLNIVGVHVKGIENIPENAETTLPVFFPQPDGFMTDISFMHASLGGGGSAQMNFSYTLHYRFLHSRVGSSGGLLSTYAPMIHNLVAILVAIFSNDDITGAVDMTLQSITNIGPLPDPVGNQYHGVDIGLRILEFVQ